MKERIIGLDILRILSMCGIIGVHLIGAGGGLELLTINSFKYYYILFIYIVFKTSVNTFGILTGYLYADRLKPKNRNIISIIFSLIFYCLLIPTVLYGLDIFNLRNIGFVKLFKYMLAPLFGSYWYIVGYILLFFLIPYINILIKKLEKNTLKKLLLTLFILLSAIPTFLGQIDLFRISNGFSGCWLIYLYMIGAYIRIYGNDISMKKIFRSLLFLISITFLLNLGARVLTYRLFEQGKFDDWFISYTSPFMIFISAYILFLFKKLKTIRLKKVEMLISKISVSVLSVYIIHGQPIVYENLLSKIIPILLKYNDFLLITSIFVIIFTIYFICIFIDKIRIFLFNLLQINCIQDYIGEKMDKYL